ncbi:hypothetical protein THI2018120TP_21050 [Staphylococcus aureus]|nr:uncharacterized protein JP02758_1984 [Staphylococcus aureus]BCQ13406.1 hypothetical protein THI2018120TP_21050 [Staphylococcus aureus]BCQ18686.1 hypothetical protein BDH17TP_20130 [Staphylococcus aureus]BCQ21277.1 hypothetical protein S36TP_19830 [Staphylococcus aureus]
MLVCVCPTAYRVALVVKQNSSTYLEVKTIRVWDVNYCPRRYNVIGNAIKIAVNKGDTVDRIRVQLHKKH